MKEAGRAMVFLYVLGSSRPNNDFGQISGFLSYSAFANLKLWFLVYVQKLRNRNLVLRFIITMIIILVVTIVSCV